MKLQVPFIQLPVHFDAAALAAEIAALGEGPWRPHPQGFAGNSMLPLVSAQGEAANEAFSGPMRPTPELFRCPYLTQVFASLGATVGRSRLMRLSGHAEVTRHADQGYYWTERVRVHIPIVTQPTVRFECDSAVINMAPGECWIFDTWRQHRVLNDAVESRIHLVVDTVGGGRFWDMVNRGRPHDAPTAGWQAVPIAPKPGEVAPFPCERVNVPVVMSPWELNDHLGLLFADAVPHPSLPQVRQIAMRFARTWQGLWFEFGEREEGHARYAAAVQRLVEDIRGPSQPLMLKNELRWFNALMTIVCKFAVTAGDAQLPATAQRQREMGDNA
ncbi:MULTISPECIES: aspartyl/asparaginyl beta-hydroxylase domain-containing protein [unclassified Lysobacter]|uniref:aspartyl/asparaginyl beta-hydroxylase domain-containing protein n=1 Tax=unclassified Lysobacter TaxID=2635362 RepID=UPI001C23453C|nr:aspartyl/asparaginyl beta-hydroxylase domain-containing protein [Lysobacter sp. MMG2]MBU8977727.1 aspartyl/asparaginyl beta-hydroxylase domain-containing protein [Lysobacter sp. MMG2]